MTLEEKTADFFNTPADGINHTIVDYFIFLEKHFNNTTYVKKDLLISLATTTSEFDRFLSKNNYLETTKYADMNLTALSYQDTEFQDYDILALKNNGHGIAVYLNNNWYIKCSLCQRAEILNDYLSKYTHRLQIQVSEYHRYFKIYRFNV